MISIRKACKYQKKRIVFLVLFLLVTLVFISSCPRVSAPPDSVMSVPDLEVYLEGLADHGNPPGMSLVVVKNDSIVYSKGFGWADKPRKIEATPETVYHWWSITKIVTAIAILQLQEQGKLQLDDAVAAYLPFFKVKYPSTTSKPITIRNLLNHSSGIPDLGFRQIIGWIHHEGEPPLNQTALLEEELPGFSRLLFEPGKETRYTNVGYIVLGAIIEKVTNMTYEEYIRQNILGPLGMNHTDFVYTEAMKPFEAAGTHPVFNILTPLFPFLIGSYIREISGNQLWLKRVYTDQTPSTALIGSAADAARLVIACLNNGELEGKQVFSEQLMRTMNEECYIDDQKHQRKQGIGWQIYNGRGGLSLQHDGGGVGFYTIMRLFPDKKLGFILFTNDVTVKGWRILNLADTLDW